MRWVIIWMLLLLTACQGLGLETVQAPFIPPQAKSPLATPVATTLPAPELPTPTSSPVPVLPTTDVHFTVRYHPDLPLYVGDQVSLEVIPVGDMQLDDKQVLVGIDSPGAIEATPVDFGGFGIAKRQQATLNWVWDTSGLEPGDYMLRFSILPEGPSWSEQVTLLSESEVPHPEPEASWARARSDCCMVNYITGTAAERDLPQLLVMIEEQAQHASELLGITIEEPISITFLPRVLGHGGFASRDISVSYLDRNYAGNSTPVVLHHEIVHELDGRLGGELRPTLLVEGLAVYLTGGHFKLEPLMPRAAALLSPQEGCISTINFENVDLVNEEAQVCGLGWYLPLISLLDDFYFAQHEIGYLQAGALVEYMVQSWGWEAFSAFYRDIHPHQAENTPASSHLGDQAQAVDVALQKHFDLGLSELEARFLEALQQEHLTPELVEDVRLSIRYYDTLRHYQQILDPSAYFLTAWLADGEQMRERGIVADYLRRPSTAQNLALETMFVNADAALRAGDYRQTNSILQAIHQVLENISLGNPQPFSANTRAADHYAIVQVLLNNGYQPQKISVNDHSAQVWVSKNSPHLVQVNLVRSLFGWTLELEAQSAVDPVFVLSVMDRHPVGGY